MWKRIRLLLLLVIVGVPACGLAYLYLRKPAQVPASTLKVAMTPERIARGRFVFQSLAHCDDCHSERDFTRFGGPVVESGRGRGNVLSAFLKGCRERIQRIQVRRPDSTSSSLMLRKCG